MSNDPDPVIVSTMVWKGGEPYIENNSAELVRKTLGEYYSRELKIAVDVVIDLMRRFAFERLSLKRAEDSLQFELSKVRNMIGLPLSEEIKRYLPRKAKVPGRCYSVTNGWKTSYPEEILSQWLLLTR